MKALVTLTLLVSATYCAQHYPGTDIRPVLSDLEAASFTKAAYFQGWIPPAISINQTEYTVGEGGYSTIQAAVNAAIKAKGTARKYINITQGTYNEVVYIPTTKVPITLYGAGYDRAATVISLSLSALSNGSDYKNLVGHLFSPGDPGYKMFASCARKSHIGTSCSSLVWAKANKAEIVNLTIQNRSKNNGTDQAVALYMQGDQTQVSNCRLLSHQDTFWSGGSGKTPDRGYVTNTHIEGDVDFVFGSGSTVFEGCTFFVKSDRRKNVATIFAPSTPAAQNYGFLVTGSVINGDESWYTSKSVHLARAWDTRVNSTSTYKVGSSPNGQLVVRESTINGIINVRAPYATATSGRPYVGNVNNDRNIYDNGFHRFYEFANAGDGA